MKKFTKKIHADWQKLKKWQKANADRLPDGYEIKSLGDFRKRIEKGERYGDIKRGQQRMARTYDAYNKFAEHQEKAMSEGTLLEGAEIDNFEAYNTEAEFYDYDYEAIKWKTTHYTEKSAIDSMKNFYKEKVAKDEERLKKLQGQELKGQKLFEDGENAKWKQEWDNYTTRELAEIFEDDIYEFRVKYKLENPTATESEINMAVAKYFFGS